jgi:4-hydroxy-tetrahydrodipicolinate synthase
MLGAGCHAFFVNGSTGRGPWWNRADRVKICSTAAEHLGEAVPLFAGCMASGLADMIDNARAMADAGAQVAVVTAPGYFAYAVDEVESIFLNVADASPIPVLIYDIPAFAGMKLDGEMIMRLASHDNVVGFKDSTGDMERIRMLMATLSELSDFYLLQGKEHLLAESLLGGCSGFVVSLAHIDPRPFVALAEAAFGGDAPLANAIQAHLTDLLDLVNSCFERRPPTSTIFYILDYALRQRGACDNILLPHEADCPDWLRANCQKALDICEQVASLLP